MRIRIPLIIEESLIKQIDEIAGEKHRRAATIETALREFVARQARKAKAEPATKAEAKTVVRGTVASAAKSSARSRAESAPKAVSGAKRRSSKAEVTR
jgi:hypothetical protein